MRALRRLPDIDVNRKPVFNLHVEESVPENVAHLIGVLDVNRRFEINARDVVPGVDRKGRVGIARRNHGLQLVERLLDPGRDDDLNLRGILVYVVFAHRLTSLPCWTALTNMRAFRNARPA